MKLIMFAFMMSILFFLGCKKDCPKPVVPPVIINDSALNVIWKKPIGYGTLSSFTGIYGNIAIFSINESNVSFNDIIIGLDKTTGNEVWKTTRSFYLPSDFYQKDNVLYFEAGSVVYAINLYDGNIIWETECPYSNMYRSFSLNFEAGKLWINWSAGDRYNGDSTILFSIEPFDGVLNRIHSWESKDNDLYQLGFRKLKLWMHPKGDSILMLTSGSYKWNTNQSKADLIAWNLNADSAYFDFRNYSGWDGVVDPLVINNNLLLYNGWEYAKSINLLTLKINWNLTLPDANKSNSHLTYHSGYILTQLGTNRDAITWIDPNSGKISRTLSGSGNYFAGYHFKDNWLYFSSGFTIKKVDYNIPKIVWEFESPEERINGNKFNGHMALDAPNDLIYITDKGNFYCFKINK